MLTIASTSSICGRKNIWLCQEEKRHLLWPVLTINWNRTKKPKKKPRQKRKRKAGKIITGLKIVLCVGCCRAMIMVGKHKRGGSLSSKEGVLPSERRVANDYICGFIPILYIRCHSYRFDLSNL